MNRLWDRYASFVERRRGVILLAALTISVASAWCASRLDLRTDFAELLPRKATAVKELERLQKRLGGVSTLVVAIEGGDWKAREKFAEEAVRALKEKLPPGHVTFIDYEINQARGFYERNQFLYADLKDLEEVRDRLKRAIADAVKKETVVQLDEQPAYKFDVEDLKKKYQARVAEYDHFPDGYFITPDRSLQTLLLRIPSSSLGETSTDQIIEEVRAVVEGLHPDGYRILIGGDPVAAQDERRGIVEDLAVVSGSTVFLVIFCMILYYRSARCLVLIGSPVAVGTLVAFAVAELVFGNINSNTAFLGSIILGNGINFGIILLARYLEERREGADAHTALRTALSGTWVGTATAAMAAAMAYGSLMVTDFRGFSQFGFIGGVGMIACWLSTMTVMPAMISLLEARWPMRPKKRALSSRGPALLGKLLTRWRTPIALGGITITLVSAIAAARFYRDPFEYDFRKLRANTSQKTGASALGRRVDRIFDGTRMSAGSPAVVLADRWEQVEPLVQALDEKRKHGGFFDRAEWIKGLLPPDQEKKIAVLDEIRDLLDHKVLGTLSPADRKQAEQYRPREGLKPVTVEELPEMVTRPFVEKDGRRGLVVFVYPPAHSDMLIGKELLQFAEAIRETRLPNGEIMRTSGHEVVLADILHEILSDGPKATAASFLGVLILVMLAFRKNRDRALVLTSLVVGVIWMCGAASLLGIKINMLNFVALPITFGIGVEYPSNVYRRYLADGKRDLARAVWFTGSAVALCSLTTIIGYGSLLFADTRALNSFGLLAVVGEVTTLVAALLWLPSLVKKGD